MNKDIMGNIPVVGDTIIRAKYDRDSSLYMCKVTGENKSGNPKIAHYWRVGDGSFQITKGYGTVGYVLGDFFIVQNFKL